MLQIAPKRPSTNVAEMIPKLKARLSLASVGGSTDRVLGGREHMRVLAAVFLLALWPVPTVAGGTSSTARVIEFVRVSDSVTTFTVKFSEPFSGLGKGVIEGCSSIKVWAEYRPGWWFWRHNWSRGSQVTRSTHADALAALERAHATKQAIHFGTMGTGLRERADKCSFDTRGLAIRMNYDGKRAVIAYHDSY